MIHNDPKVDDLVKRMLKLSTSSNMSVGQVAEAHYRCIAGLALEICQHDKDAAAKLIRKCMDELADYVERPDVVVRVAVEDGKVVKQ